MATKTNKSTPVVKPNALKSIAAKGQKQISYEIVNLPHGNYSVGKLPPINTEALTTNEVNYLVSIKWPYISLL